MALGDLVIKMSADIAQFQSDMGRAAQVASRTGREIQQSLASIRSLFATLGAGLSIAGITAYTKSVIDAQDKMGELAKSTQIAATTIAALAFAGSTAGASMEGLAKGIGSLNLKVAEALGGNRELQQIFQNLGISLKELRELSPDQLFLRLADIFAGASESANTSAYANKLFGKSFQEVLPVLADGADKIRKNTEYFKLYSGVTEESIKKSDELNDELKKLSLVSSALGRSIINELIDPMKFVVDKLIEFKEKSEAAAGASSFLLETFKELSRAAIFYAAGQATLGTIAAAVVEGAKAEASFDFAKSKRARDQMLEDVSRIRAEADATIASLGRLQTKSQAAKTAASGAIDPGHEGGLPNPGRIGKTILPNLPDYAGAKAAGDALQKLLNDRAKLSADALKDAADKQQALLDAAHADGLVSERDYWQQSLAILKRGTEARLAVLDDEIAQQQKFRDKQRPGSADYYQAQQKLEEQIAARAKVASDAAQTEELGNLAADKSARQYARSVEELNIQLLELQGNLGEAARRRAALNGEDFKRKLTTEHNAAGLADQATVEKAAGAQGEFNQAREAQSEIVARLAIQEERLQNALRTGAISEIEAMKRTGDARKNAADQLEAYVANLERIAGDNPALKQLALQAEQARAALEKLRAESDLLAEKFDTIFKSSFADAFADFISGTKTAREAFDSFTNSVLHAINKMVAEALAAEISKKLGLTSGTGSGPSVIGSVFSRLFGGGGAAAGAAGAVDTTFMAALAGYAEGTDYVPATGLYKLHQGEAVIPADENRSRGGMTFAPTLNFNAPYDGRTRNQVLRDVHDAAALAAGRFG